MIFNYSQYSDYYVAMNICDMYSALVNIVYMMLEQQKKKKKKNLIIATIINNYRGGVAPNPLFLQLPQNTANTAYLKPITVIENYIIDMYI